MKSRIIFIGNLYYEEIQSRCLRNVSSDIKALFYCRKLSSKSNTLHINLFIAFILRAIMSFLKESLFVDGLGLEKDLKNVNGVYRFREDVTVGIISLVTWFVVWPNMIYTWSVNSAWGESGALFILKFIPSKQP